MVEASIRLLPRAVDDLRNIGAYWRRNITPDEADRITGKILRDLKELKLFYPAADSIKYEPLKSRNFKILKSQNYICICKKVEHIIYVYHIAHLPTEYPDIFGISRYFLTYNNNSTPKQLLQCFQCAVYLFSAFNF